MSYVQPKKCGHNFLSQFPTITVIKWLIPGGRNLPPGLSLPKSPAQQVAGAYPAWRNPGPASGAARSDHLPAVTRRPCRVRSHQPSPRGGYSVCDGWYICAAVLTPFFHFGRIEHDLFGVFFSSTNSKAIFWGTKTTNFYKNRSFWPQIQFFPRSFWVQFSAASGTPHQFSGRVPPPGPSPRPGPRRRSERGDNQIRIYSTEQRGSFYRHLVNPCQPRPTNFRSPN